MRYDIYRKLSNGIDELVASEPNITSAEAFIAGWHRVNPGDELFYVRTWKIGTADAPPMHYII